MQFDNLKLKEILFVVEYEPEAKRWTAENRTSHIMGVQLQGDAMHYFKNQAFNINAGNLYFLNQKDDYRVQVGAPSKAFSVHFTTYEEVETDSFVLSVPDIAPFVQILKNIEVLGDKQHTASRYFYQLCEQFTRILSKKYHPKDQRIGMAQAYMDVHFKEENCLDEAAKLCGITRRRFNDIFKNHVGMTPNNYITECKCALAKQLLLTQMLSVHRVAEMCGFDNIYYFSKVFKQKTGVTPTEFKKNASNLQGE